MSEPRPLCAALRAKGFYVHLDDDLPPEETATGVFWCLLTQGPIGPDSDAVSRDCCTAERACFRPSDPA